MTFAFDTSVFSRELETAGIYTHDQAEKFSMILARNLFGLMVSKQDLKAQEDNIVLRMTLEIEKLRSETTKQTEQLRSDMTEKLEKSRADSDAKHAETQLKIEQLRSETTRQISQLQAAMERGHLEILKWCVIATCTIIGTTGAMFALTGALGKLIWG